MLPRFLFAATLLSTKPGHQVCPPPSSSPAAITVPFHAAQTWSTTQELGAWLMNTFDKLLACCGLMYTESAWRWTAKLVVRDGDRLTVISAPGSFMEAFRRYSDRNERQRWLDVLLIGPPTVDGAQYASFRVHTCSGSAAY